MEHAGQNAIQYVTEREPEPSGLGYVLLFAVMEGGNQVAVPMRGQGGRRDIALCGFGRPQIDYIQEPQHASRIKFEDQLSAPVGTEGRNHTFDCLGTFLGN